MAVTLACVKPAYLASLESSKTDGLVPPVFHYDTVTPPLYSFGTHGDLQLDTDSGLLAK